jgi:hypothetical protein
VKVLSPESYKAFSAVFPRSSAARILARDARSGGARLTGEALRVCADLVGYGEAVYQLEGEDDGCFALFRFRWDSRSEAFLLRTPGIYEPNSRLLVIVQGRAIVAALEVASGMGDAGESVEVESVIADFDGDGSRDVLTRTVTTYDRDLGMTEPDTTVYSIQYWRGDHFEERAISKGDPVLGAFAREKPPSR